MRGVVIGVLLLLAIGTGALLWFGSAGGGVAPRAPDAGPSVPAPSSEVPTGAGDAPLRVVLLTADMATPAARRSVQIYAFQPRRMEPPTYVRTIRTGADGVAEGDGLGPGSFIVCAPGASPRSPEPRTARVTLVEGAEPVVAYVVEPPAGVALQLEVRAAFTPQYGIAPKLLLRRKDDGSGELFAQPGLIRPGAVVVELEVPPGRYQVDVEPIGELLVSAETSVIDVSAGGGSQSVAVALEANPGRIDVRLIGLPEAELPARVYPQPADGLLDDRPERSWWGPHRWHRPDLQVPTLDGVRRVLVFGRSATFRSESVVDLSGDRAEVVLEPATRVVVDWFDWDPDRDTAAIVVVEVGDEAIVRTLSPRFGVGYPELERPAMGGEVVVPRVGSIRLECQRADGSTAWERTVELDTDPVRVRIQ